MEIEDLTNRFSYHPPSKDRVLLHESIRENGQVLALILNEQLPESREKSLAITHLEEVVMWANAALARN